MVEQICISKGIWQREIVKVAYTGDPIIPEEKWNAKYRKGPKKEPGKSAAIPINKLQMDEMKCGMVREKRGGEIVKGAMV